VHYWRWREQIAEDLWENGYLWEQVRRLDAELLDRETMSGREVRELLVPRLTRGSSRYSPVGERQPGVTIDRGGRPRPSVYAERAPDGSPRPTCALTVTRWPRTPTTATPVTLRERI
jgi:hypothetical protein